MPPKTLVAACLAASFLSLAAPARAQAPAGPEAPRLRALAEGGLEVHGPARSRALLLLGEWGEEHLRPGQRVRPRACVWVVLDPTGRLQVPFARPLAPLFAQLWLPAGPGAPAPGLWSGPIVLLPEPLGGASPAKPGDLVITEFMKDPTAVSDAHGEYIEVHNNLRWRVDLDGVILSDQSGAAYTFSGGGQPLWFARGADIVLGNDLDPGTNGGIAVDLKWNGFSLKNSGDEIYLHDRNGVLIDGIEYDDGVLWPDTPGMSISLNPSAMTPTENDDPANWCHSSTVIGTGPDTGTPGAVNDICQ